MTIIERPRPRRSPARRRLGPLPPLAFLVWAVVCVLIFIYPIGRLVVMSFTGADGTATLENYHALLQGDLLNAVKNSVLLGAGSVIGSCLVGVPLALLVSRTDMPGKKIVRFGSMLAFAAPSFIASLGWLLLLGPRNGLLNRPFQALFGLESGPFNAFSPWTLVFVMTLYLYPLVFMQVTSALDNIDPSLEEAARSQGASWWTTFRRVLLPLLLPAITSGSLLVFVVSCVIFGPVAVLGAPVGFDTIPTAMLTLLSFPPRLETAAVLSAPVLLIIGLLVILQRRLLGTKRYTVLGGKPKGSVRVSLGRWRIPAAVASLGVLVVGLVLPYGILLLVTFQRHTGRPLSPSNLALPSAFVKVWQAQGVSRAFISSFLLAIVTVLAVLVIAFIAAWLINRTGWRLTRVVGPVSLAPLAFPGAVIAIGLIIVYGKWIGGGYLILLIAYVCGLLPFAFGSINSGMQQLGTEMDEASRSLGAGWLRTWRRITVPLLHGSLISGSLIVFVFAFRELESSIFLYGGRNPTTATVLYEYANRNDYQMMGAISVYILAINIALVVLASRWGGRGDLVVVGR